MIIYNDVEQGSDEWHKLRLGCITASRFKDVLSGGQGKTRLTYMREVCAEILTCEKVEGFTNEYMQWGVETEPQAKDFYTLKTGNDIENISFIKAEPTEFPIVGVGCSPDGLIGDNGLIEIKCPKTTTQIETFLSGEMPSRYTAQVQGQLWVSGREWCDFVSFDPRINGESSFFCTRVFRDEGYISKLSDAVYLFRYDAAKMLELLK